MKNLIRELETLASVCPEINMSNYTWDDVNKLNEWAIEMSQLIDSMITSEQDEAISYGVWWGMLDMRKHPRNFNTKEEAEEFAKTIKSNTEVRPIVGSAQLAEDESQGRIGDDRIEVKPEDVIVEIMTDDFGGFARIGTSGVRLHHKPTGIVVECKADRSQHRNRDKAWKMLEEKLNQAPSVEMKNPLHVFASECALGVYQEHEIPLAARNTLNAYKHYKQAPNIEIIKTTGHCKEKAKPGGCQLHNLHCGYPQCDTR